MFNFNKCEMVLPSNYKLYGIYYTPSGYAVTLLYRPNSNDYVVAWNYNEADGTWGQGHYFSNYTAATKKFREYI